MRKITSLKFWAFCLALLTVVSTLPLDVAVSALSIDETPLVNTDSFESETEGYLPEPQPVSSALEESSSESLPPEVSEAPPESSEPEDPGKVIILRLDNPKAIVDGSLRDIDDIGTRPFILDNKTYVPLRFLNEQLGAEVKYDGVDSPIVITKEDKKVRVTLDNPVATINDSQEVTLSSPARLIKGKAYVPIRDISELFGYQVKYFSDTAMIVICEKEKTLDELTAYKNSASELIIDRVAVTAVKLDKTSGNLTINATTQLDVTLVPENAANTAYVFTSSNDSIATVSSNGLVKAIANGSATITVKSGNGKTAEFALTVGAQKATGLTTTEMMQVAPGASKSISYTVTPSSAASDIVWSTSNSSVATVDSAGVVKGVSSGTCWITAKNKSGSVSSITIVDVTTNSSKKLIVIYKGSQSLAVYKGDSRLKLMLCSTGLPGMETPTGKFSVYFSRGWMYFPNSKCYVKYGLGIQGNYIIHTQPYSQQDSSTASISGYNALGSKASHGCVRTAVIDTMWLNNNCPVGTQIYITEAYGPRGTKHRAATIYSGGRGWDPTDPDPKSPYNK